MNRTHVDITCESKWSGGTQYSCDDNVDVIGGYSCNKTQDGSHYAPYSSYDIGGNTKTITCDSNDFIQPIVGSVVEVVCIPTDWKKKPDGSYVCGYEN